MAPTGVKIQAHMNRSLALIALFLLVSTFFFESCDAAAAMDGGKNRNKKQVATAQANKAHRKPHHQKPAAVPVAKRDARRGKHVPPVLEQAKAIADNNPAVFKNPRTAQVLVVGIIIAAAALLIIWLTYSRYIWTAVIGLAVSLGLAVNVSESSSGDAESAKQQSENKLDHWNLLWRMVWVNFVASVVFILLFMVTPFEAYPVILILFWCVKVVIFLSWFYFHVRQFGFFAVLLLAFLTPVVTEYVANFVALIVVTVVMLCGVALHIGNIF